MKEFPFNIVAGLKAYNFIKEGPGPHVFVWVLRYLGGHLFWGAPFLGGTSVASSGLGAGMVAKLMRLRHFPDVS